MSDVVDSKSSLKATVPQKPSPLSKTMNKEEEPADLHIPDNYVSHVLKTTKSLPPITWSNLLNEIQWISFTAIFAFPIIGLIGASYVSLRRETLAWSIIYYFMTGLGITAGYHRLWAHRAYNAPLSTQYVLACLGAGSVQGSIKWWSRGHRAHHRYTDTELDPYNAHKGFWYAHIGWMLVKPRRKPGVADVSDLSRNPVVKWQHKHYITLLLTMAFLVPTLVAHFGWGDAKGGFVYAGVLRLVFVHHFPMDFRNAIKWYQYDPTKWTIWVLSKFGLASHLKVFPDNEVRKGQLTMQLKRLKETQDSLHWPSDSNDLPVVNWETFQKQSAKRPLVLIAGFIHDVSGFVEEHPGGAHLINKYIGKDATTAFFGGVYDHSNAAHNLLAMKRVGILNGGHPHALDDKAVPPGSRLKIARYTELNSSASYSSSTAWSDGDD
ncbi:stearoyl-CoA 9-desaturase [Marasmius crinis-equi]|uniref:Acyl-CoA desaturase n=1 Tax=Marasmius crinis-equi TaxID=585013 RepID=A0ABR3EQ54_9AGAR